MAGLVQRDQPAAPPSPSGPDTGEQRSALLRLAAVVVAIVVVAVVTGTAKTVAVVAAIVAMIMLHELGHFATAKWSGMKVTEYFLGFGPRLWSIRRGETEYGVKALPLGGYVKISGMSNLDEVDPADEARTYRQAPFWRRIVVVSAGSLVHFLIAIVLIWVLLAVVGQVDYNQPVVGSLSALRNGPSPAQQAGLRPGDRILAIDGHPVHHWEDIPPLIQAHPGSRVSLTVERGGATVYLHATPVDLATVHVAGEPPATGSSAHVGFLGIAPAQSVVRENPAVAVGGAAKDFGSSVVQVVTALGQRFSPSGVVSYGKLVTNGGAGTSSGAGASSANNDRFVSPVGLVRLASDAANSGVRNALGLLVMINVFVGVFNLVPLLPLDGGHVAVAVYERIRSRRGRRYRVDIRNLLPVTYLVLLVLLVIGATSIYLDIAHPLPNPFVH